MEKELEKQTICRVILKNGDIIRVKDNIWSIFKQLSTSNNMFIVLTIAGTDNAALISIDSIIGVVEEDVSGV